MNYFVGRLPLSIALLFLLLLMSSISIANPISLECEVDLRSSIHKMSWIIDVDKKVAERHFEADGKPYVWMFPNLKVSPTLIRAERTSGDKTDIEITDVFTISRANLSLMWRIKWVSPDPFYNLEDEKSGTCAILDRVRKERKF